MATRVKVRVESSGADIIRAVAHRTLDSWSSRPSIDLAMAVLVVGGHAILVYGRHTGDILQWANQSQRLSVYAAGAGMMSLIAGFAGTAIAQYGSSSGPVVAVLRSLHGRAIRRNWLNISGWLLAGTLLCVVAMAVDSEKSARSSEWIFEASLCIAVTKFIRLLFLFGLLLSALDSEVEKPKEQATIGRGGVLSRGK